MPQKIRFSMKQVIQTKQFESIHFEYEEIESVETDYLATKKKMIARVKETVEQEISKIRKTIGKK